MPTPLPTRPPVPARRLPLDAVAAGWLAGLILLAAIAGAGGARGSCAAPPAPPPTVATAPAGTGAALADMLAHD